MKIIIEIPEKTNARIRSDYETGLKGFRREDTEIVCDAIYNGRPIKDITDEQISDAFQVAIVNYWEEKSKYLTPPPSPCCDSQNIGRKMEHGEWRKRTFGYLSTHDCSVCGFNGNQLWHFCPSCGADMRKEGDENG